MGNFELGAEEKDEWARAARAGAARRRKALVPVAAAVAAFAIVFGAVLFGLGAIGVAHDDAREAEKKAILERGGTVHEWVPRGSTKESRAASSGAALFIIAGAAGLGAALVGYVALGGKLSAEYARGLKTLGK